MWKTWMPRKKHVEDMDSSRKLCMFFYTHCDSMVQGMASTSHEEDV